jgi:hypothetical protein
MADVAERSAAPSVEAAQCASEAVSRKRSLVLVMNCQGEEISALLSRLPEVTKLWTLRVISTYQNLADPTVLSALDTADLVLCNCVKAYPAFTPDAIRKRVCPRGARVITVEFLRFAGFDDSAVLETPWIHIPEAHKRAKSLAEFHADDGASDLPPWRTSSDTGIRDNFCASMKKLRELDAASDLKFFDFFEANYQFTRLFRDRYHPAPPLFKHLLLQLLPHLGISDAAAVLAAPPCGTLFSSYASPLTLGTEVRYALISNRVKRVLGLRFDDDIIKYFGCTLRSADFFLFAQRIAHEPKQATSFADCASQLRAFLGTLKDQRLVAPSVTSPIPAASTVTPSTAASAASAAASTMSSFPYVEKTPLVPHVPVPIADFNIHDVFWTSNGHLGIVAVFSEVNPDIVFCGTLLKKDLCPASYCVVYTSKEPASSEARSAPVKLTFPGGVEHTVTPSSICADVSDKIVMTTMMKDEDAVVLQWLEFHRNLGVGHFVLYDNGGPTSTLALTLTGCTDVTLIDWPFDKFSPRRGSSQITAHNHCLRAFDDAAFIGVFDVDEYVNPQRNEDLRYVLDGFGPRVGGVMLKNKFMFNSSNVETAGNSFLRIAHCDKFTESGRTKLFVRPRNVVIFCIHEILRGAATALAPTKDLYFNHFWFLNKAGRGRSATTLVDATILAYVPFPDPHPSAALAKTLYVGSCRYQNAPFPRFFPPRLHSTAEMLHFFKNWPDAQAGLSHDELKVVFGDSTHPQVEAAFRAFVRLGPDWMRGIECVSLEVCAQKFGRLRPSDPAAPPCNAHYGCQYVPGFVPLRQSDADVLRDLEELCGVLKARWGVRKVLLIPHIDLPTSGDTYIADRHALHALLEYFASSAAAHLHPGVDVACADSTWILRAAGIRTLSAALPDGFHFGGSVAGGAMQKGLKVSLVRLMAKPCADTDRDVPQAPVPASVVPVPVPAVFAAPPIAASTAASTAASIAASEDLPLAEIATDDIPLHVLQCAATQGITKFAATTLAAASALIQRVAAACLRNHVVRCIERAELRQSRTSPEILAMRGLSGFKTRHLYNNLVGMFDARYLEIGTSLGATIFAAMCDNCADVIFINNRSGGSTPDLTSPFERWRGANTAQLITQDCFSVDVDTLSKRNIFVFDGDHKKESVTRALTHYFKCLDDVFVYVVDDWNWKDVRDGTRDAIAGLSLTVAFETEVRTTQDNTHPAMGSSQQAAWHNGIFAAVLVKAKDMSK